MAELQERLARALTKRYAVKAELGRGGMSVVFLAWDRKHECDVALQVLRPEQSAAKRELDGRSDIYSLGLVLYEMLTGEPPRLSVDGTVKTLERLRHDVPPGVGEVLRRALAADPEDRFATAGDFVAALARAGPRPFYERRRVQ